MNKTEAKKLKVGQWVVCSEVTLRGWLEKAGVKKGDKLKISSFPYSDTLHMRFEGKMFSHPYPDFKRCRKPYTRSKK